MKHIPVSHVPTLFNDVPSVTATAVSGSIKVNIQALCFNKQFRGFSKFERTADFFFV